MANGVGRPRKFKSPMDMYKKWEEFKEYCNNRTITKTEFSQKLGKFVSQTVPVVCTYTLVGFCAYCGYDLSSFYDTYKHDEDFSEIVALIERECEVDVREKLEFGAIPTQLSNLWMSKYGYSTKQETEIKGSIPVIVTGEDNIPE